MIWKKIIKEKGLNTMIKGKSENEKGTNHAYTGNNN